MNAKDVLKPVRALFGNYDYKLFNSYMYAWECDFWALSTSKYAVEVEVKISRSDFFADFKKLDKHKIYKAHKNEYICLAMGWGGSETVADPETKTFIRASYSSIEFKQPQNHLPNKFYYACPEGLIKIEEVPVYAGLIYVNGNYAREVKKAPFLHKNKIDKTGTLLGKYYNRSIAMNNRLTILLHELDRYVDEPGKKILQNFISTLHFD